jgi:hypothetical protein
VHLQRDDKKTDAVISNIQAGTLLPRNFGRMATSVGGCSRLSLSLDLQEVTISGTRSAVDGEATVGQFVSTYYYALQQYYCSYYLVYLRSFIGTSVDRGERERERERG